MPASKTQIDRLGERLKEGPHAESDLRLLDEYRRSFGDAYHTVLQTIRQRGEHPTGRLAKSTGSIIEKLRRESIRLSQMQDIAGCRIVVGDIVQQEQLVASLRTDFPGASVIDRREDPSFGYRAVHIIVKVSGKPVEIQVRSALQHLWAELSEKASDVIDPAIKYGGGPDDWRRILTQSSEFVADYEKLDESFSKSVTAHAVRVTTHKVLKRATEEKLKHEPSAQVVQASQSALETLTRDLEQADQQMQAIGRRLAYRWKVTRDLLNGMIASLDDRQPSEQKQ